MNASEIVKSRVKSNLKLAQKVKEEQRTMLICW